jgi:hypothetical protein
LIKNKVETRTHFSPMDLTLRKDSLQVKCYGLKKNGTAEAEKLWRE